MRPLVLRRCIMAVLLGAVTIVALLGMSPTTTLNVMAHPCEDATPAVCMRHAESGPATQGYAPLQHDPCLHDHACAGGAALGLGSILLAVVGGSALPTPGVRPAPRHAMARAVPVTALLIGGIERPPRLVH